jgi:hypothetical protein
MRIMTVFWDFAPYNQARNDEGSTTETSINLCQDYTEQHPRKQSSSHTINVQISLISVSIGPVQPLHYTDH